MNVNTEEELKKCKNDPVYFAEKYLGYKLYGYQKIILRMYILKNKLKGC